MRFLAIWRPLILILCGYMLASYFDGIEEKTRDCRERGMIYRPVLDLCEKISKDSPNHNQPKERSQHGTP